MKRAADTFRRAKRIAGRILALAALTSLALWAALEIAVRALPLPAGLDGPPERTVRIVDRHGKTLRVLAGEEARLSIPIPLEDMGRWIPAITVFLEDRRFHRHHGLDIRATIAAAARNLRNGRVVSGGSTITQQLIKRERGRSGRKWSDKLTEAILALKLERRWSKDAILERYLNRNDYGNRRLGPESAARSYFGKNAADLTLAEAAYLAGLPQSPTRFNPWNRPDAARAKYRRSLQALARINVIDADRRARLDEPPAVSRGVPESNATAFVDALRRRAGHQASRSAGVPSASVAGGGGPGGILTTTLDLDLQDAVAGIVRSHQAGLRQHGATQAAVVVIENATGAVRALCGSIDDGEPGGINGALVPRSCGSTLKPFIYLMAIERKILTAASLLPDTPDAVLEVYPDWDPGNFNHRYLGPVRVRDALANSLNIPAVLTTQRIGAREAFRALGDWGIAFARKFDAYGAGFVLGTGEVSLLDLTSAYAGLARGGIAVAPRLVENAPPTGKRVASADAAAIVQDILCDNAARSRSFGLHSPLAFSERVAAKTGTSSEFRDLWTLGFNRDFTVGVWVGNFNGRPTRRLLAARGAAPIWREVILHLRDRRHARPLAAPAPSPTLARRQICSLTGLVPSPASPGTAAEWFLAGTEPRESSLAWFRAESGGRRRLFLPPEFAAWCRSGHNYLAATVDRPGFRLLTPRPGAAYVLDPVLPPGQQALRFEAVGAPPQGLQWSLNGSPLPVSADGSVRWTLEEGRWEVTALSPDGRSASADFRVLPARLAQAVAARERPAEQPGM